MMQRYGGKPLSIVWTGWTPEICIFLRINQFFITIRTIMNKATRIVQERGKSCIADGVV